MPVLIREPEREDIRHLCPHCKKEYPLTSEFWSYKKAYTDFRYSFKFIKSRCRSCLRVYNRLKKQESRERAKEIETEIEQC